MLGRNKEKEAERLGSDSAALLAHTSWRLSQDVLILATLGIFL